MSEASESGSRPSEDGLRSVVADVERELRFRAGLAGTPSWAELTAESMLEIADDLRDALSVSLSAASPVPEEGQ